MGIIKGIAFDIDGTLINHEQAAEKALSILYPRIKKKIPSSSLDEFLSIWGIKADYFMKEYLEGKISFKKQRILRVKSVFNQWNCNLSNKDAWTIFQKYSVEYERNWELFEDVLPCFTMLKNFPLGIISNGSGEQQRKKLSYTGIDSLFRSIIISEDVGARKPQSTIYQLCAKELNLSLNEMVYVGDQLDVDIIGALDAGVWGVWINRTNQIHANSNIIAINKLTDLRNVVENL